LEIYDKTINYVVSIVDLLKLIFKNSIKTSYDNICSEL